MAKNRGEFHPTIFKLMATEDKLTAAAGLSTINGRSSGSYRLGLIQLNSFIYGHDCLDDLEEFRDDPLLEEALQGKVAAPKTIGDFLRDFEAEHHERMNRYLRTMARAIREQLIRVQPEEFKPNAAPVIDMDSTSLKAHPAEEDEGSKDLNSRLQSLESDNLSDNEAVVRPQTHPRGPDEKLARVFSPSQTRM